MNKLIISCLAAGSLLLMSCGAQAMNQKRVVVKHGGHNKHVKRVVTKCHRCHPRWHRRVYWRRPCPRGWWGPRTRFWVSFSN